MTKCFNFLPWKSCALVHYLKILSRFIVFLFAYWKATLMKYVYEIGTLNTVKVTFTALSYVVSINMSLHITTIDLETQHNFYDSTFRQLSTTFNCFDYLFFQFLDCFQSIKIIVLYFNKLQLLSKMYLKKYPPRGVLKKSCSENTQ